MRNKRLAGISILLWIASAMLLLMLAFNCYYHYFAGIAQSFSVGELLLEQINSRNTLCFALFYVLVLLFGGRMQHCANRCFAWQLICCAAGTLAFVLWMVLCNEAVALFCGGSVSLTFGDIAPLNITVLGMTVVWLRFFSVALFITCIDRLMGNPKGALMATLLGVIDFNFYYYIGLEMPTHLSAIEHSLVTYDSISEIDYFFPSAKENLLYWAVVLVLLTVGLYLACRFGRESTARPQKRNARADWSIAVAVIAVFSLLNTNTLCRMLELNRDNASSLDIFYITVMSYNIMMNAYPALLAAVAGRVNDAVQPEDPFPRRFGSTVKKACVGGAALTAGVCIPLLVIMALFPAAERFSMDIFGTISFAAGKPAVYLALFLINTFAVGFCYAILARAIAYAGGRGWLALFLPNLISSAATFYPFRSAGILDWFPIDSYDIAAKSRPLVTHIFSIAIIAVAGLVLLALTAKKKRANGEE